MIHTISLADVAPTPWRNGGGETQELFTWPGPSDWQVRISVARIDRDGPFSAYPGIARWFAVLTGAGVRLGLPAGEREVRAGDSPLAFDGNDALGCALLAGPTRDLNLMVRNDAGSGQMLRAMQETPWTSAAPMRAVFTLAPCRLHRGPSEVTKLVGGTLLVSDNAAHQEWHVSGEDLRAYWLAFQPF